MKPSRKVMDFGHGDGRYDQLPPNLFSFWSTLQAEIHHKTIGAALIEKFAPVRRRSVSLLTTSHAHAAKGLGENTEAGTTRSRKRVSVLGEQRGQSEAGRARGHVELFRAGGPGSLPRS